MRALLLPLTLLASTLVACGDKDDDAPGDEDSGPVDADADGVPASEDCDDGDPQRFPGNEEIWYDGIDQDCDGNDNDQDGDGVSYPADCDDTDPTVNPTMEETWYDGVDQDCDGANDYDQDRDGFNALESPEGSDCDDTDASVFPGAADAWYDGVDANCDGASDYDQDGDGFDSDDFAGDDCDDLDEAIFPGAEEVWYDGVDQDCAADDDFDQDGDGHAIEGSGGSDCVDTDPDAFPGAVEQIDGQDTDCDGAGDSWSVDSSYGGTLIQGLEQDGLLGWDVAAGDVDGDAFADVAMIQRRDAGTSVGGDGLVHVFPGSTIGTTATSTAAAGWTIRSTIDSGPLDRVSFLPDLNGDGTGELVVTSLTASYGAPGGTDTGAVDTGSTDSGGADSGAASTATWSAGAVWLFSAADGATASTVDDATWTLQGTADGLAFGAAVSRTGDLDGDGIGEVAVGATGLQDGDGGVMLYLSGSLGAGGVYNSEDADRTWTGVAGAGGWAGAAIAPLGDLNGDGLDELAVSAPNGCGAADATGDGGAIYIVGGSTVDNSGAIDGAAWGTILGGTGGIQAGAGLSSGDLDGDGVLDLAVGAPCEGTQAGRVHYVSGADLSAVSVPLSSIAYTAYAGSPVFAQAASRLDATGDVTGDGRADVLVGGAGASAGGDAAGTVWLSASGATSSSLTNAAAVFAGGSDLDQAGRGVALGDINGDGKSDLIFGVPGEDIIQDEGAVYIGFSGF